MVVISHSVSMRPRPRGKRCRFNLIKAGPPASFIPVVAASCVAVGPHLSDRSNKELTGWVSGSLLVGWVGGGGSVNGEHVREKTATYVNTL